MVNTSEKKLEKVDLLGMNGSELAEFMDEFGQKPYRAKQIFLALHKQCVASIDDMTCISKVLRQKLQERAVLLAPRINDVKTSRDGTKKYILETFDGKIIESVFIPGSSSPNRNTICISSQIGCAMDCTFCATAKLGFGRNLLASEIIGQIYLVVNHLKSSGWLEQEWSAAAGQERLADARILNNIVFMGMGEPLHNYKNVVRAIDILRDENGQNYSTRRITVSTSGVVKNLVRLGHDSEVQLAISLNATTDPIRSKIMPINKKWNITQLLLACKEFPLKSRRRITFEYVLLADINDSEDDALRLAKLLDTFPSKINLIPFNEFAGSIFKKPKRDVVLHFQKLLQRKGFSVFIRSTRGDDVDAACGMLAGTKRNDKKLAA